MSHFWVGRKFPPVNGFAYMVYALALMCSWELYENYADFNATKVCREVDCDPESVEPGELCFLCWR